MFRSELQLQEGKSRSAEQSTHRILYCIRSDEHEGVEGRSAEQSAHIILFCVCILCSGQTDMKKLKAGLSTQSAHTILSCVCVLCSGQMDMEKAKAGLQSSQHTVLCLYIAFRSDRREEVEGRSAE